MHRLVVHQPLQQRSGAVPVDPLQLQEADIEPGSEQPAQIRLQCAQHFVVLAVAQQEGAQIDQEFPTIRNAGELRQQA